MKHWTAFIFIIAGALLLSAAALHYRTSRGIPPASPLSHVPRAPDVPRPDPHVEPHPDRIEPLKVDRATHPVFARRIAGEGPLRAKLHTSEGTIRCRIFEDEAPMAVQSFVGLAMGWKAWEDPGSGAPRTSRFYDGLTFHRVVPGFLIQTGDPTGNGTYTPGYSYDLEVREGLTHAPGTMGIAHRGQNPDGSWSNGSQFYITEGETPHLDGDYTVFGRCEDLEVVKAIARVPRASGDKPVNPVRLKRLELYRGAR